MTVIAFASALGIGLGIAGLVAALSGPAARPRTPHARSSPHRRHRLAPAAGRAVAAAVPVLAVTRWPVAGAAAALAAALLPPVLGRDATRAAIERLEAVASWTELVRDTLGAAAGLAQALVVSAPVAPAPIRPAVGRLADRLVNGMPLEQALRALAEDLADPSADMVVCALLLAATARAQQLGELLGALADTIRQDVSLRLRVDAGRASARSGVRTIILFSLLFAGGLLVVGRSYLAPFGTVTGQLVLAVVVALYAAGVATMLHMVRPPAPPRLLSPGQEP